MRKVLPVAFREYDVLLSLVFKRLLGHLAETPPKQKIIFDQNPEDLTKMCFFFKTKQVSC